VPKPARYVEAFEDPLDLASWLLRSERLRPGRTRRAEIPKDSEPPKDLDAIARRLLTRGEAT
jgi:hypothetical protein